MQGEGQSGYKWWNGKWVSVSKEPTRAVYNAV